MIIDLQTHLVRPCRMVPGGASSQMLLAAMDAARVDKAVIISYEGKDILPDTGRDPTALGDTCVDDYYEAQQAHPDRFFWFIDSLDPREERYLSRVERDLARGAQGIKMFPAYVETLPSDPRYTRLYDLCRERRLPVIIAFEHWNNPEWGPCVRDYREFLMTFEPVADAYPDIQFLLTHWGCFSWGEHVCSLTRHMNFSLLLLICPARWKSYLVENVFQLDFLRQWRILSICYSLRRRFSLKKS